MSSDGIMVDRELRQEILRLMGLIPFTVDDNTSIEYLAKNTNFDEPLYHAVTSNAFEGYGKLAIRPDFDKVSKKALTLKILQLYVKSKKELKVLFDKLDSRFVVSCDLWKNYNGVDRHVCVSCHWINDDWGMEKRVIWFRTLYPYGYADIASEMIQALDEFNLKGKVGSISFDDSISKEKCMEHLVDEFNPKDLDVFAHDRTYADVVDLCAQQIVDGLALFIDPIRELVMWYRFSPDKRKEFRTLCKEMGVKLERFDLDLWKDWKFIYDDLKAILSYPCKDLLTKLYNDCPNHSPIEESHWDAISKIVSMLGNFDDAANRFRWAYDATCHLVIEDSITIFHTLKIYETDPRFSSVVTAVRSKWLELLPEIPTIYCVATILDPRVKVKGLRKLLAYYYETMGVNYDVDEKVATCKKALQQLYAHYARPCNDEMEMASFSEEGNIKISSSLELNVKENVLKRKRVDDQEQSGELGEYLFFPSIIPDYHDDEYFDILDWWKRRRFILHVLPEIAKDVLCTPISTTIPKSKCCLGKRVLDEKRSMLKPDFILVCICKKDWDLAEQRKQGEEDNEGDDAVAKSDSEADD